MMKTLFTLLFLFSAFTSNAQRTMFGSNNNYVAPEAPATVSTNNLILNLNASGYSGSGSNCNDASTQNNTATLVGSPNYSSNPASFTFGPNKYGLSTSLINSFSSATFIAWVNPSQIQSGYSGIIISGGPSFATGLNFWYNNSIGYMWNDNANTWSWNSGLQVPLNEWSMVAITISSNSATDYLCKAIGIATSVNTVAHSAVSNLNGYAMVGKIGTAMVYSTTLSLEDITSVFDFQKASFG